ncbi:hypothetical protein CXF85_11705 [Colwellia sp. 75C3]|uniref:hypothetical protein n=1 Tax=Colwellia sp. 75C3 TaxID=888425 RepID=UPI000C328B15|nr:hypothetical protein [Colwellia sp. 75C3]PKG83191.1 hypothetical protein CXF85_11705 [Colwellia sp. 75C3]
MSKVITVLEKMASDAALNSEDAIADLVATSDINDGQMQAIVANDVEALVENTDEISKIKFFIPIIPAEDDEPEESDKTNDSTETASQLITVNY